jgi:hypothetical protein
MIDIRRQPERNEKLFPTHQDIQRRAYEIYLESNREEGRTDEHWRAAEEELQREWGASLSRPPTIIVGPDGIAETTPARDFAIEDEELSQVRASEKLKEERDRSAVPRSKTVSMGQQRTK